MFNLSPLQNIYIYYFCYRLFCDDWYSDFRSSEFTEANLCSEKSNIYECNLFIKLKKKVLHRLIECLPTACSCCWNWRRTSQQSQTEPQWKESTKGRVTFVWVLSYSLKTVSMTLIYHVMRGFITNVFSAGNVKAWSEAGYWCHQGHHSQVQEHLVRHYQARRLQESCVRHLHCLRWS